MTDARLLALWWVLVSAVCVASAVAITGAIT